MLVEINTVTITPEAIQLTGEDVSFLNSGRDLFSYDDNGEITFTFDRDKDNEVKYIYSVVTNNSKVKNSNLKFFGDKLELLKGQMLNLPKSFIKDIEPEENPKSTKSRLRKEKK